MNRIEEMYSLQYILNRNYNNDPPMLFGIYRNDISKDGPEFIDRVLFNCCVDHPLYSWNTLYMINFMLGFNSNNIQNKYWKKFLYL